MAGSASVLGVSPESLWEKVGVPLLNRDMFRSPEAAALSVIRQNGLTENELAFLILAGADHLFNLEKGVYR